MEYGNSNCGHPSNVKMNGDIINYFMPFLYIHMLPSY